MISEVSDQQIKDIVDGLEREPLTHLMLGHRELFHSNLLSWFFEQFPGPSDEVFCQLSAKAPQSTRPRLVRREHKHLDLWLQWPDRLPVVIENKVFSITDERQLEQYSVTVTQEDGPASFWLLSLMDPGWPDDRKSLGGCEWRWLRYKDLASRIRAALSQQDVSYGTETLRHYADMVDFLTALVATTSAVSAEQSVTLPKALQTALGGSRLHSPMQKVRSSSVAKYIKERLTRAGLENPYVEAGLTNGTALNSWFWPVRCADGARAGWQLQGEQFRLALILPHLHGRDEKARDARTAFGEAHRKFFDFAYVDDCLGTANTPVHPPIGFRHYSPDFIYRYKKVPNLTLGQLCSAATAVASMLGAIGRG